MPEYKSAPSAIKSIEGRTVVGIASVFGNVDDGNDRMWPGSFTKTIRERRKRFRHLWNHDFFSPPIASIDDVREVNQDGLPESVLSQAPNAVGGLQVTRTYLNTPRADEVFEGIKAGAINEMSFGYDVIPGKLSFTEEDGRQVREIYEVRLFDTSDVLWGLNQATAGGKHALPLEFLLAHLDAALKAGARHSDSDIKLINQIASAVAKLGATNIKLVEEDEGKATPLTAEQIKEKLLSGHNRKDQAPVGISGLWLRAFSEKLQVLAEVDGDWRIAIEEMAPFTDDLLISHIAEPLGIRVGPIDGIYIPPAPVKETSRAEQATPLHSLTLMRHQRQTLDLLDFIGAS